MFGFLKDKLKKAVKKFSKDAEEEVKEEKVDDSKAIEQAKHEEKKIVKPVKKPITKKEPPKPKTVEKKPTPKKKEKKPVTKEKTTPSPDEKKKPEVKKTPSEKKEESETKPQKEEKKSFLGKLFGKKDEKSPEPEQTEELDYEDIEEELEESEIEDEFRGESPEDLDEELDAEEEEESSGFFGKLKDTFTKKTLSEEKFDELFWELEVTLLENNVAVEVIEKIKDDLRTELTSGKVNRMGIEDMILNRLRQSVEELFDVETFDLLKKIESSEKPYKICVIGVNGSGKTTTLAKLVHLFQKNKLSVVVAASDTFRAAAIDQLKEHTDKLGVKLISQGYEADPAAVAYDAIEHAKARNIDVVLIDTAGRLHSNTNLMAELEKVVRVSKPDLKLFVGESITGNDCVEQAKTFDKLVGIDALILSKADIDDKGGAALSVSYVTGKPIIYIGTGQKYDDLEEFNKKKIIKALGL